MVSSKKIVRCMLLTAAALVVGVQPGFAQGPIAGGPVVTVTPGLQVNIATSVGPGSPLHLTAQMVQNIRLVAPYQNVVLTLAPLVGSPLTPTANSPGFSEMCALTNSNTMLECTLRPDPGPGWSNQNPLTLRVRLRSTSGHVATALVLYNGGPQANIQLQVSSGTGLFPSTSNAAPLYLLAQLFRNTTHQVPLENDAIPLAALASHTLTPAAFSLGFDAACSLTNGSTMFECILTPNPGPNWSVGGPLMLRVRLVAADGSVSVGTVSFRISP